MSATGRKQKTTETGDEFYPTPRKAIRSLIQSPAGRALPGGTWIDPCAGTGRIVSEVNALRDDVSWIMCELNDQFEVYLRPIAIPRGDVLLPYGDFVHRDWSLPKADVLIMNPPFSLTMDFVLAALERARWVCCLQRQGWFGTKGRSSWLADHCPDIRQLPTRLSFRPDNKTDNCEYCWFVWPPSNFLDRKRFEGVVSMLPEADYGQQDLFA